MNDKIDYTVGPSLFQKLSKKRRNKWVDELTLPRVDKNGPFLDWAVITAVNNNLMIY